jgi:hypothetical protein
MHFSLLRMFEKGHGLKEVSALHINRCSDSLLIFHIYEFLDFMCFLI